MIAAICDDDKNWREKAQKIIEDYAEETFLELETFSFCGKDELLAYTGEPIQVIFLDIQLDGENGIQLAEEINKRWKNCQIVYLTNYLYYAMDVYQTEHTYFVLKNQFEERLPKVFQKVLHAWQQKSEKLIFQVIGGREIVLCPEDILCFERIRRITVIETVWGRYEIWDKLSDIVPRLSELDFVRCHNSYIVYLPAVVEMYKDAFILRDGRKIVISRSYSKQVKQKFMKWALTQTT